MDNIKERISHYQETGHGERWLVETLATRAYEYALTKTDADGAGDLVADLIPRIPGMLDRYRDAGIPFDHYYNSVICWRLKAQLRRKSAVGRKWRGARIAEFWDSPCGDDDQEPQRISDELLDLFERDSDGRIVSETNRKRFLLAMLRRTWSLDQTQIEAASRLADVPVEWLTQRVDRLRMSVSHRLSRIENLRQRRDRAYAAMRLTQEQLAEEVDPDIRDDLRRRATRSAAVWRAATEQMGRISLVPTHRQLAAELGIPRGTVGTSFRWLRMRAGALHRDAAVAAG